MKVECRKSSAEADSVSANSEPQAFRCLGLFLCLRSGAALLTKKPDRYRAFWGSFLPKT